MGCLGDREKGVPSQHQKWDFITLDDFRCTSFWSYPAYAWLWFMAMVSVAVYTVDTFTAVNLLAYDKWSSQVQPALPFKYSKWLFAACIILSWALCLYSWIRAFRVIQRGGVAESYMDPLAVSLQSMRSLGWKRFLVFSELTKSKKGTDYIALFVYFSFQGAIRVVLAEGPRQGVNAMTLYAVLTAQLLKTENQQHHSAIQQFFLNIETLADANSEQAAIYFSMLFTLVIWVFSALSLITSVVLYLLFLWHYIPSQDGTLSAYCRRKIDKRLAKVVEHKVIAAMEEEERQHKKAEQKAELKRQKTGEVAMAPAKIIRAPTLPDLGKSPQVEVNEKMPSFPLGRQGTNESVSTLPLYSNAPPSQNGGDRTFREPTLPGARVPVRPGMPPRMGTQSSAYSNQSYSSDAPLLANAGFAGEADQAPPMPAPTYNRQNSQSSLGRPVPGRTFSQSTQASQRPFPPDFRDGQGPLDQGPPRFNTPGSRMNTPGPGRPFTPASRDGPLPPPPPGLGRPMPPRSNTDSISGYGPRMPPPRSNTSNGYRPNPQMPLGGNDRPRFESEPQPFAAPTENFARPFAPPARSDTASPYRALTPSQSKGSLNGTSAPTESIYAAYNGQQSFTRKPPSGSFNRPFTPSPGTNEATFAHESYEMQPQPSHSVPPAPAAGAYVAFNPNARSASRTPSPPGGPKTGAYGSPVYDSGHLGVGSQGNTHHSSAHTSTYGGLLDDYGADEHDNSRTPSPAEPHRHAAPL